MYIVAFIQLSQHGCAWKWGWAPNFWQFVFGINHWILRCPIFQQTHLALQPGFILSGTMWGPLVINWFINPSNYSYLRTINHSEIGAMFTNLAFVNGGLTTCRWILFKKICWGWPKSPARLPVSQFPSFASGKRIVLCTKIVVSTTLW